MIATMVIFLVSQAGPQCPTTNSASVSSTIQNIAIRSKADQRFSYEPVSLPNGEQELKFDKISIFFRDKSQLEGAKSAERTRIDFWKSKLGSATKVTSTLVMKSILDFTPEFDDGGKIKGFRTVEIDGANSMRSESVLTEKTPLGVHYRFKFGDDREWDKKEIKDASEVHLELNNFSLAEVMAEPYTFLKKDHQSSLGHSRTNPSNIDNVEVDVGIEFSSCGFDQDLLREAQANRPRLFINSSHSVLGNGVEEYTQIQRLEIPQEGREPDVIEEASTFEFHKGSVNVKFKMRKYFNRKLTSEGSGLMKFE